MGVAGHRGYLNFDLVSKAIEKALRKVFVTYGETPIVILSPLAEGADRHVVWPALENYEVELTVPVPMETTNYLLDFKTNAPKAEFAGLLERTTQVIQLPTAGRRKDCYQAAGYDILDHSDALIALWDGAPARGVGGTAQIVRKRAGAIHLWHG